MVESHLDGRPWLTYKLPAPVSGKVDLWSKADSYVLFDAYRVAMAV